MTAAQALAKLLDGTGFVAVAVRADVYRLQPAPKQASKAPRPATAAPAVLPVEPDPQPEIIVTGQKRPQILSEVPMSIAVVVPGDGPGGTTRGGQDIALSSEGLALTNLGPGRNRQFIRGVADSPFIGPSQSTVAVQLDNARVTFDAPDPDLRLIDVERVEILKGPQGPLYGSGALGGIYHVVTRKPKLDETRASIRAIGESVAHGSLGFGGEAVANLPLVTDRLALRVVGYATRSGGWIDDVGRRANANVAAVYGGRLGLRWQPSPDWTIDLGVTQQDITVADSQYVTTSDDTLRRIAPIPEPSDNDFRSASATIEARLGGLTVVSATSYVDQSIDFTLDASASAVALGTVGPTAFRDDRSYSIVNQEVRVSPATGGRWLAGASYLRATSHSEAVLRDGGNVAIPIEALDRVVTEYALFGEARLDLAHRLQATAGARLFYTVAEDEAVERSVGASDTVSKAVLSPSLALSWAPRHDAIVYLRYARSLRPGGLAPAGQSVRRFDADELGTLDLGVRRDAGGHGLTYSGSLFYTQWNDIQSDYLLANGLVSTRNAGRARILGAEAAFELSLRSGMRLSGGVSVQDARLTHSEAGLEIDDRRLPVAPDTTARLALSQEFDLGAWHGTVGARANYVGTARLTFDQDIDRPMGRYATVSASASARRRGLTLLIGVDNLFDVRGDSFAFGNPFSIRTTDQYVPLRPRTITVAIGRAF